MHTYGLFCLLCGAMQAINPELIGAQNEKK